MWMGALKPRTVHAQQAWAAAADLPSLSSLRSRPDQVAAMS